MPRHVADSRTKGGARFTTVFTRGTSYVDLFARGLIYLFGASETFSFHTIVRSEDLLEKLKNHIQFHRYVC